MLFYRICTLKGIFSAQSANPFLLFGIDVSKTWKIYKQVESGRWIYRLKKWSVIFKTLFKALFLANAHKNESYLKSDIPWRVCSVPD
jgi:hypothetical protein